MAILALRPGQSTVRVEVTIGSISPRAARPFYPQQQKSSGCTACPKSFNKRRVAAHSKLGHSHDYVCLNFGNNFATSVSVCDPRRGEIGCGL